MGFVKNSPIKYIDVMGFARKGCWCAEDVDWLPRTISRYNARDFGHTFAIDIKLKKKVKVTTNDLPTLKWEERASEPYSTNTESHKWWLGFESKADGTIPVNEGLGTFSEWTNWLAGIKDPPGRPFKGKKGQFPAQIVRLVDGTNLLLPDKVIAREMLRPGFRWLQFRITITNPTGCQKKKFEKKFTQLVTFSWLGSGKNNFEHFTVNADIVEGLHEILVEDLYDPVPSGAKSLLRPESARNFKEQSRDGSVAELLNEWQNQ